MSGQAPLDLSVHACFTLLRARSAVRVDNVDGEWALIFATQYMLKFCRASAQAGAQV